MFTLQEIFEFFQKLSKFNFSYRSGFLPSRWSWICIIFSRNFRFVQTIHYFKSAAINQNDSRSTDIMMDNLYKTQAFVNKLPYTYSWSARWMESKSAKHFDFDNFYKNSKIPCNVNKVNTGVWKIFLALSYRALWVEWNGV